MFARELGGELFCVHYLKFRSPLHAPIKYVLQSIRTLQILFRERAKAVHVQSPPFVCALVVDLYCRISGASFVIEHHSASFGRSWRWALPAQKLVARRAAVNIVTHEHWAEVIHSWGADALVMYDPFLDLPEGRAFPVRAGSNVAFVGTFASDEPLDAVLEAAALVPDVHFYITGDTRHAQPEMVAGAPSNVTFTGFLELNGEYVGLLRAVDAVLVLTTRDHTLQLAGCEAISVGKPVVTSDWPYLRELFGRAAVFVDPSAEGISRGVREAIAGGRELSAEIGPLKESQQRRWRSRLTALTDLVATSEDGDEDTSGTPTGPEMVGTTSLERNG